jgi:hypothetical protein
MSVHFLDFPSLWCNLIYAHLTQFFISHLDEKILDHVGIKEFIFDLNG